ncbi:MAG: hypothetical protein Q9171_006640 [Xanthocarpia ochracea]
MDRNLRSSSAPLLGSTTMKVNSVDCASKNEGNEEARAKHTPRSPGYFPNDNSLGRLEFENSEHVVNQLVEFARTTPPNHLSTKPTFPEGKATTDLTRTDSGRRRRILENIGGNGSHPQKPLKKLFGLSRSVTTSDLSGQSIPRGSMDVASKHSSGGRKYMKIAINPKMYEFDNPSTYKVNFKETRTKGKTHRWIYRISQPRPDSDTDASSEPGHISHLSSGNDDHGKQVTDDICDPAKTATNQASNGYSPSKGIPKPELGIRDFMAATLATAEARTRRNLTSGHVSKSPEKLIKPSRQHESPIRKHGNHIGRRRTLSKGPYSVPIKFQLQPQRTSPPKTPRTSLDEPATTLKDTSPPAVNGTTKSSPTKSSPAKSGSSFVDDGQSDAESGKIMNARRAEFIHGQGAYAYHNRSARTPPKPGPAPTRALPSLPEGHDGVTPLSTTNKRVENKNALPSEAPGHSPQHNAPKALHKGHRYRLSPVKNSIPADDSRIRAELKPSPAFAREFPQPPTSSSLLLPRRSEEAISTRTITQKREVDVRSLKTGRSLDISAAVAVGDCEGMAILCPGDGGGDGANLDGVGGPSIGRECGNDECESDAAQGKTVKEKEKEKEGVYLPWQEGRVERIRAIKVRDLERVRARERSVDVKQGGGEKMGFVGRGGGDGDAGTGDALETKYPPRISSAAKGTHLSKQVKPAPQKEDRNSHASTKNDFSPIIVVAEQHPYTPNNNLSNPSTLSNDTATTNTNIHQFKINHHNTQLSQHDNLDNDISNSVLLPSRPPIQQQQQQQQNHTHSHSSALDIETRLEARIVAMERKNRLLERAFWAVIEASSGGGGSGIGNGSGYFNESEGDAGVGMGIRRRRSRSKGSRGDKARVDEMLDLMGVKGRKGDD